jgi:hypothetical protein
LIICSNSTGGSPLARLCLRRVLYKSAIHVAIFSRAAARVVKRCRWMYSTLISELNASAALPSRNDHRFTIWDQTTGVTGRPAAA